MLTMDLRHRKLMSGLCSLSFHDWLLEWIRNSTKVIE
ncbi:Uncharacterised protein [Klebsiella variicola]|nr:Uncharacterised protein [Klebsiella variicola]SXF91336.1 Uncharacterised protein [Klebsiella variicola]